MKVKILSILVLITVFGFTACSTYSTTSSVGGNHEQPAFDREYSVVVDAWSDSREYHDYLKIYNATQKNGLNFNIFGYNAKSKNWILLGRAELKRYGDTDTVDTPYRDMLNRFRYFAVQSLNELSFDAQVLIKNNDVYLIIF